jgi:hypothetical protein
VILSLAFALTLYLDSFDEVNRALSFQTILFSRSSARFGELLLFRRFINILISPILVKRFGKVFLTFFEDYTPQGFELFVPNPVSAG